MKKSSLPSAEEIAQRLKEETLRKEHELQYSSEESGSNEVMRRFLGIEMILIPLYLIENI